MKRYIGFLAFLLILSLTIGIAQPQKTVRLSGWAASPEETKLLKEQIADFEKANPDVKVVYEPITGDYWMRLQTMLAAGTEPDVFYMDVYQSAFYIKQNVLLPINYYMSKYKIKPEDFVPALINAFAKGKIYYGIPKDFNTLALFYNKSLFAKAGIPEPTDKWTWDDLKKAAKIITEKTGVKGLAVPADAARFIPFALANGGKILTKDEKKALIDSPEVISAAKFYTSFRKEGIGIIPSDVGAGWPGEAFGREQVAMVLEGGWMVPYLKEQFPNVKYGAVELPSGPKGRANLIFTVAYSISKRSKVADAAFRLVAYLTGAENQLRVLRSGFALPTRKALEKEITDPISLVIFKGASYGTPFKFGIKGHVVLDNISKALEQIYLAGVSEEEAFKNAAQKINTELKE
ncbi:MAG: ABC transporter substrate-binding protein [Dictyoglomaceae bacterium]